MCSFHLLDIPMFYVWTIRQPVFREWKFPLDILLFLRLILSQNRRLSYLFQPIFCVRFNWFCAAIAKEQNKSNQYFEIHSNNFSNQTERLSKINWFYKSKFQSLLLNRKNISHLLTSSFKINFNQFLVIWQNVLMVCIIQSIHIANLFELRLSSDFYYYVH